MALHSIWLPAHLAFDDHQGDGHVHHVAASAPPSGGHHEHNAHGHGHDHHSGSHHPTADVVDRVQPGALAGHDPHEPHHPITDHRTAIAAPQGAWTPQLACVDARV